MTDLPTPYRAGPAVVSPGENGLDAHRLVSKPDWAAARVKQAARLVAGEYAADEGLPENRLGEHGEDEG
jgi:hypothetical protein